MNAPLGTFPMPDKDGYTPASLGIELFEGAQRKEVVLSDADGCAAFLLYIYPSLTRRGWRAARRIAIDLHGQAARDPDARLVTACRSALAQAEKAAAGDLTMAEALTEISDLLAGALVAAGQTRP